MSGDRTAPHREARQKASMDGMEMECMKSLEVIGRLFCQPPSVKIVLLAQVIFLASCLLQSDGTFVVTVTEMLQSCYNPVTV